MVSGRNISERITRRWKKSQLDLRDAILPFYHLRVMSADPARKCAGSAFLTNGGFVYWLWTLCLCLKAPIYEACHGTHLDA